MPAATLCLLSLHSLPQSLSCSILPLVHRCEFGTGMMSTCDRAKFPKQVSVLVLLSDHLQLALRVIIHKAVCYDQLAAQSTLLALLQVFPSGTSAASGCKLPCQKYAAAIRSAGVVTTAGTVFARILMGNICDLYGPRYGLPF